VRRNHRPVGAAQRTGAATDPDAGEHVSLDFARAARRLRPDSHGRRNDAATGRPAGGKQSGGHAGGAARSARRGAGRARKGADAVPGAASGDAGGGGIRKRPRYVPSGVRAADGSRGEVHQERRGGGVSAGIVDSPVPGIAGGPEQRGSPFGIRGGGG